MSLTDQGYRGLDPNKTVWQRLNLALREVMDDKEADRLTPELFPYILAERKDAS